MENSPKRRKHKDNPYVINYNEINNTYIIAFNLNNKQQKIKVSKEIYDAFNSFELDDLKQINEYDRHIEHLEQSDIALYKKAIREEKTTEDVFDDNEEKEQLRKAIDSLSDIQKRRIIKYYFDNKNEYQIAKEEGTTHQSVHISLERAKQKLKEILKNLKI